MKSWFVIMSNYFQIVKVRFFKKINHKINQKIKKYIGVFVTINYSGYVVSCRVQEVAL